MTGTINPLNYIKGEAYVWVGTLGAAEPAQTNAALVADPGAGWTFIGATQGGVSWDDSDTISDTIADQVIDPIGGRVTARKTTLTFNLLEPTLARLAIALNNYGSVTTPASGISVFDPGQPTAGSIPSYNAYLIDGQAPQVPGGGKARRRAIFRKVLNAPKVTTAADPTKDTVLAISASCYYVSSSISPYIVMDQTA